jgi:hypothetical protein
MKRILILAAMASVSTSAFAAETTSEDPTVQFSGNRAQVCEVRSFESNISFGPLTEFGDATAVSDSANLYCNVRFNATIASQNGFLKLLTGVPAAQPVDQNTHTANGYTGFASALDYSVTSTLGNANTGAINGGIVPVALGGTQNPINVPVNVTYDTIPESLPLLGGTYADTLYLNVTPIAF